MEGTTPIFESSLCMNTTAATGYLLASIAISELCPLLFALLLFSQHTT